MLTEDFCDFETAKLLKEKNCPDFGYSCICDSEGNKAQTQSIIMKWLREEKGIAIIPILSSVLDFEKFLWNIKIVVAKTDETYSQGWTYEKYERAVEAGIKYCLENLI